jgi:hypothetical protein
MHVRTKRLTEPNSSSCTSSSGSPRANNASAKRSARSHKLTQEGKRKRGCSASRLDGVVVAEEEDEADDVESDGGK